MKPRQRQRRTTNSASSKHSKLRFQVRSNLWGNLINGLDDALGPYTTALQVLGDKVTKSESQAILEELRQTFDKARRALLKAAEEDDRRLLQS